MPDKRSATDIRRLLDDVEMCLIDGILLATHKIETQNEIIHLVGRAQELREELGEGDLSPVEYQQEAQSAKLAKASAAAVKEEMKRLIPLVRLWKSDLRNGNRPTLHN